MAEAQQWFNWNKNAKTYFAKTNAAVAKNRFDRKYYVTKRLMK
jgi:hypothetical protein